METINERIAAVIEDCGMNVTTFSKMIGVAQTSLRGVVKDGAEPKFTTLEKIIIAEPSINTNWLITGKGEMRVKEAETTNTPVLFSEKIKGAIPYYADLPVSAGQMGLSNAPQHETPSGYMLIPNVSAEWLFPVIGCSMLPLIKPGDVIGVNTVNRWERVEPDKIYMIITRDERMIKRLRIDAENEEILWCVSDNYKEFKIEKSEITGIFHVVLRWEIL